MARKLSLDNIEALDSDNIINMSTEFQEQTNVTEVLDFLAAKQRWKSPIEGIFDLPYPEETIRNIGYFAGPTKWVGGVLAPNGSIYFVPYSTDLILKLDPVTEQYTTIDISSLSLGTLKFIGAALARNGKIYFCPSYASSVLVLDTWDDTFYTIAITVDPQASSNKWGGACLGQDGNIYFVARNSRRMLKINPYDDTMSAPVDHAVPNQDLFAGLVTGPNGALYAIPTGATVVQRFNVGPQTFSDITSFVQGTKFLSGVLGPDQQIYMSPFNSQYLQVVDPYTDTISTIHDFGAPNLALFAGACQGADGRIYYIPFNSTQVGVYDIGGSSYSSFGSISGTSKYFGGVLAPNGNIYCVPLDAESILVISTGYGRIQPWKLGAHVNKY